jgi:hypothetical protein
VTALRDARLKKALEEAPDADLRPASVVSHTIRAAARNVMPTAKPVQVPLSWWQRLWQHTGRPRSAWGAAFATVLVAVLVTVLWVREPIPDARPIAPSASPPQPSADAPNPMAKEAPKASPPAAALPAPNAMPTPAQMAPAPKAPRVEVEGATPSHADSGAQVAASPAPRYEPTPAPVAPSPVPSVVAPQERAFSMPDVRTQAATGTLNKSLVAPPPQAGVEGTSQRQVARSSAPAAVAGEAATAQATAEVGSLDAWDALRVHAGGRTVTLDRVQGRKLAALLLRLQGSLQAPHGAVQPEPAAPPDVQITVLAQEQVTATFTLQGLHARWQSTGQPARSGSLDENQAQSLVGLARDALAADSSVNSPP